MNIDPLDTEAQIMELGSFIAFHYGMQAFARTLDADPRSGRETAYNDGKFNPAS